MRILKALTIVGITATVVSSTDTRPAGCHGQRNEAPVFEGPATPLKTVKNGESWMMKDGNDFAYIAKLRGTPFEMGYAYGQLFPDELKDQMQNGMYMYPAIAYGIMEEFGVPMKLLSILDQGILLRIAQLMMDINWLVAKQWIPQRYEDELQGMAEGAGMDVQELRRMNILPELTQAHCTVTGAWGVATKDNRLLHLRGLDWDAFAPINKYPSVILYEPTEEGSSPFANIGYLGLIGTLTAMSKAGISAGEKVMIVNDWESYPQNP
jgi:hypothetical protein